MKRVFAILLYVGTSAFAQDSVMSYPPTWKLNPDGSIGPVAGRNVTIGSTVLLPGGAGPVPATCTVGQMYFLTASPVGLYQCTATNTWTLPGGDTWRAGLCMAGTCNGDTANGRWMPSAATPKRCSLTASTAPSGSGISVDVLKNGTTSIFTSPIALAAAAQSAVVTSFAATTFNTTTDYATVALTGTTGSGVVLSCLFQ